MIIPDYKDILQLLRAIVEANNAGNVEYGQMSRGTADAINEADEYLKRLDEGRLDPDMLQKAKNAALSDLVDSFASHDPVIPVDQGLELGGVTPTGGNCI